MRKEICVNTGTDERWACIFVTYGEGVRLPLEDMENIFGGAFAENVEIELEDNEPLYIEDEGDKVPVITIPTLIDAVMSTDAPDKTALYNLLMAVESTLVNIWG